MNAIRDGFTRYTLNAGITELREAICHKLKGKKIKNTFCFVFQLCRKIELKCLFFFRGKWIVLCTGSDLG